MSDISQWSPNAAGNTQSPPDGWPEGMARAAVNDCARETHAAVRRHAEDGSWFDWGHTITWISGTQFQPGTGDQTATYSVGRRVRAIGSTTGKIYGVITDSAFTTNTVVTVLWDSGSLTNETLAGALGPEIESLVLSSILPGTYVEVGPENETSQPLQASVVETLPGTPDPYTLYFVTGQAVP